MAWIMFALHQYQMGHVCFPSIPDGFYWNFNVHLVYPQSKLTALRSTINGPVISPQSNLIGISFLVCQNQCRPIERKITSLE
jgi:hypothetical protein